MTKIFSYQTIHPCEISISTEFMPPSFKQTLIKITFYSSFVLGSLLLIAGGILFSLGITAGTLALIGAGVCIGLFAVSAMVKSMKKHLLINKTLFPVLSWNSTRARTVFSDLYKKSSSAFEEISQDNCSLCLCVAKLQEQLENAQSIQSALQTELETLDNNHSHLIALKNNSTIDLTFFEDKDIKNQEQKSRLSFLKELQKTLNNSLDLTPAERQKIQKDIDYQQKELFVDLSKNHSLPSNSLRNELLLKKYPASWSSALNPTDPDFLDKLAVLIEHRIDSLQSSLKKISEFIISSKEEYTDIQNKQLILEQDKVNLLEALRILKDLIIKDTPRSKKSLEQLENQITTFIKSAHEHREKLFTLLPSSQKLYLLSIDLEKYLRKDQHPDLVSAISTLFYSISSKEKITQQSICPTIIKPTYDLSILSLPTLLKNTSCSHRHHKAILISLYIAVCVGVALLITGIILFSLGINGSIGVITTATFLTGGVGITLMLNTIKKLLPDRLLCNNQERLIYKNLTELRFLCQSKLVLQNKITEPLVQYHKAIEENIQSVEAIRKSVNQALIDQKKKKSQLANMIALQDDLHKKIDIKKEKSNSFNKIPQLFLSQQNKNTIAAAKKSEEELSRLLKIVKQGDPDLMYLLETDLPSSSTNYNAIDTRITALEDALLLLTNWLTSNIASLNKLEENILQLHQCSLDISYSEKILSQSLRHKKTKLSKNELKTCQELFTNITEQLQLFDQLMTQNQAHTQDIENRKMSFQTLKITLSASVKKHNITIPSLLDDQALSKISTEPLKEILDDLVDKSTQPPKISRIDQDLFDPQSTKTQLAAIALANAIRTNGHDFYATIQMLIESFTSIEKSDYDLLITFTKAKITPYSSNSIWRPYRDALSIAKKHDHLDLLFALLTNKQVQIELEKFLVEWMEPFNQIVQNLEDHSITEETLYTLPSLFQDREEKMFGSIFMLHHLLSFIISSIFMHNDYSEEKMHSFREALKSSSDNFKNLTNEEFDKLSEDGSWWPLIVKNLCHNPQIQWVLFPTNPIFPWTQVLSCKQIGNMIEQAYEKAFKTEEQTHKEHIKKLENIIAESQRELDAVTSDPEHRTASEFTQQMFRDLLDEEIEQQKATNSPTNFDNVHLKADSIRTWIDKKTTYKDYLRKAIESQSLVHKRTLMAGIAKKIAPLRKDPSPFDKKWNSKTWKAFFFLLPSFIFDYLPLFEGIFSASWKYALTPEGKSQFVTSLGIAEEEFDAASSRAQILELVLPYIRSKFASKMSK